MQGMFATNDVIEMIKFNNMRVSDAYMVDQIAQLDEKTWFFDIATNKHMANKKTLIQTFFLKIDYCRWGVQVVNDVVI